MHALFFGEVKQLIVDLESTEDKEESTKHKEETRKKGVEKKVAKKEGKKVMTYSILITRCQHEGARAQKGKKVK